MSRLFIDSDEASTSSIAVKECMKVASLVLGFEILELWTESSEGTLNCTYIHASEEIIQLYPSIVAARYPEGKQLTHTASSKLCEQARQESGRCYWRLALDSREHQEQFHLDLEAPCRTEMSYMLDTERDGGSAFIVGFSWKNIQLDPKRLKFLSGLGYAIYIATSGFDEQRAPHTSQSAEQSLVAPKTSLDVTPNLEVKVNVDNRPILTSISQPLVSSPFMGNRTDSDLSSVSIPMEEEQALGKKRQNRFLFPVSSMPVTHLIPSNMSLHDFEELSHIEDGSNSNVFLGLFRGEKIIVKMIKEEMQADPIAIHEFDVEYAILRRLNHPNIVQLKGAGSQPRRFLVLEYMEGGSLQTILMQNQAKPGLAQKMFRKPTFTYANLLTKVREIASAFAYLHEGVMREVSVIHRDLKPANIGVSADGTLKLFDFGLSTCVKKRNSLRESYEMTGNTGSLRYMAPEVALKRPYTELVDVYSFGILVWQMARDRFPFQGLSKDEFMRHVASGGLRPKLDKSWPIGFSDLLRRCWDSDPFQRPSFATLFGQLGELLQEEISKRSKQIMRGPPEPKKENS